jgi:hypothetical protein
VTTRAKRMRLNKETLILLSGRELLRAGGAAADGDWATYGPSGCHTCVADVCNESKGCAKTSWPFFYCGSLALCGSAVKEVP